ncbi:MAG: fdrA domain protein [Atribacterota bacterium]|nr:fdrA domain protein [Atribacterota bacterium]
MVNKYNNKLFGKKLKIINIGTEHFLQSFRKQGVETFQVRWTPPVVKNKKISKLLEELL